MKETDERMFDLLVIQTDSPFCLLGQSSDATIAKPGA